MQYGSDPSIANGDSQTAEDIAREKRLTYLAEFLASNSKQKSYEVEISEQISVIEEESGENTGNTEENQNSSKVDYENSSHQNVSKISENQNRPSNKSGSESKQINYTEENSSQSQLSKKELSYKNSLTEQEDTAKSCNFQPEIDEVFQINETHCQKSEIMKNDLSCKATILRNVTNFPIRKQESEETGVGNVCSSEDEGFYEQDDQDYHLQFVEV